MDVIVFDDSDGLADEAARRIVHLLTQRPTAVLGLATGSTPIALYRRLIDAVNRGNVSFREAATFNLDEYLGLPPGDSHSYRQYMQREFFSRIDIDPANTFLPECMPGDDPETVGPDYERRIRDRGGIALQVLGIGVNGHIGFNEPGSSLGSRTRIKTLSRATTESNQQYFDDPDAQPAVAVTMGIATILEAGEILLLARGTGKASAVRQAVEGPLTASCPASALQLHPKTTVLLDAAAASELERRDYYEWTWEQKKRLGLLAGRR